MRKVLRRMVFIILIGILLYRGIPKENYFLANIMEGNKISTFYENIDDNSELYHILESALLRAEDEVLFINKHILKQHKDIFDTLKTVYYNNPEILYYSASEYSLGKLKLIYSKDKISIEEHQDAMRAVKKQFIEEFIEEDMNDYEKLLTAHDYIINNTRYDEIIIGDKFPPESHSAYGVLVLGKGVCEGYAKALKYLLDEMKIDNRLVLGESKGEKHAWNLVQLEGEYYHVDVTWDDPITKDNIDLLTYNYFNITDEELSKTHEWDKASYPKADGRKYNYFIYNDLIMNDYEEISLFLFESMVNKKEHIIFKIDNESLIIISEMIEEIYYKNNKIIKLKSYSYYIDKDYGIIDVKFYY